MIFGKRAPMNRVVELNRSGAGAPPPPPADAPPSDPDSKARDQGPAGREDGGQPQVMRVQVVADKIQHLLKLQGKAERAKEDLGDAIKSVAESAGIHASVLKRFVAARYSDNYEKARAKAGQLDLLFEEVGER